MANSPLDLPISQLPAATTLTGNELAAVVQSGVTSQTASKNIINIGTLVIAAGVPSGAPAAGKLPFAADTTAVTGGFYYWNGSAWVKISTII